jgi:alpha-methylacyl-CoA racemase
MKAFTPLEGTRVLDLSSNLPGPFLTRILADLGAEVIKVEPPRGEGLRHMPPQIDGMGSTFGGLNAGKDSLAIDLKQPEGVALVLAMAARCDVFVEAFRPGKVAALGLGVEELHKVNPRLVICSLSGYGQEGSMADKAGHDINYLAHAGVLGLFGPADGPPGVPGVQLADVGGGSLQAAIGVLAALMERERTGKGRHLDISLMHGAVAFGAVAFAGAAGGFSEARGTGLLTGGGACYGCYETADGRYLALGALEPRFFGTFCHLAERPDLADKGFLWGDAAKDAIAELRALFKSRSAVDWLALCEGHDVCLTLVRTPEEAMADPELSGALQSVGNFRVVSAHLGAETPPPSRDPSALGADAPAVMERLGLDGELVGKAINSSALAWKQGASG